MQLDKTQRYPTLIGLFLAVTLAGTLHQSAQGAPISYDEAIDGDFPETSPPILALDLGLNRISGSLTWSTINPALLDDFDTFGFAVPVGARVQSVLYEQTLLPIGSGDFDSVRWVLENAAMNQLEEFVFPVPFDGQVLSALLPWPAGTYAMSATTFGGALVVGRDMRSVGYEWRLLVTPGEGRPLPPPVDIPEPSTLVLLLVGILILTVVDTRVKRPA